MILQPRFLPALTAFLALLVPPLTQAAVTEAWVRRYSNFGGTSTDQAFSVVRDFAGDLFVVGSTSDGSAAQGLVLIKYGAADGTVLWRRRYDGPAEIMMGQSELLRLFLAAVDANGDLVVTTRAEGTSDGGIDTIDNGDFYTAKFSGTSGDRLWERRFTGLGGDEPAAMVLDAGGNVVVTGQSQDGFHHSFDTIPPMHDFYTAKYAASDGALLWGRRYAGPAQGDDLAKSVAVDADGNVVVTGSSQNGRDNEFTTYDRDIYTAKYAAADGGLLWEKRYNSPENLDDGGESVTVDSSGHVAVAGYSRGDFYAAKYAGTTGALLWEKHHDGTAHGIDAVTAQASDSGGNVIVAGFSAGIGTSYDYLIVKFGATDGAVLWETRYTGAGNGWDLPQSLALDGSGDVVVTGCSSGVGGHYDYYTAKYAGASGGVLWESRFNGPANRADIGKSVVLDGSGNAVVTGYALDADSANGVYTVKYAAETGVVLWERSRHHGPHNLGASPRAVAVDAAGDVAVTGSAGGIYTAKYALADGAMLWERRSNDSGSGRDHPAAMMLDRSGNVVVTGVSFGGDFNGDFYTAKYAATDGALLWERLYGGPLNFTDYATSVAVVADGDAVVTGYSQGASGFDVYTARYAAADGAVLWENRLEGRQGRYVPPQVVVDASGNAIVTSSSGRPDSSTDPDIYTAKYAAASGALLWENRYNGPANSEDVPHALAVDTSGNVIVTGVSGDGISGYYCTYIAKYAAATGALVWEVVGSDPGKAGRFEALATAPNGDAVVTGTIYDPDSNEFDFWTIRYAAADGAVLWERRYNGVANAGDFARDVAVDAAGTIVVTGESAGTRNRPDFCTIAYSAEGTLLWEKRYNGPANGAEIMPASQCLALGPNGMIAITGSSDGSFQPSSEVFDFAAVVYGRSVPFASFAAWAASHGLTGDGAAPDADPDHDGLPNGLEYALGESPLPSRLTDPDGFASARPSVEVAEGNLILRFRRDDASETPDLSVIVESGTHLVAWPTAFLVGATTLASSPGVTVSENGPAPDSITVVIPSGPEEVRFARIRVIVSPETKTDGK